MDAIHLPNGISLPTTFGAPGTPLQAGQVVQALVLALIESDVFRLQLPQATVDVRADVALALGSTITLAVKGGGQSAKLVIYSDAAASGQGAAGSLTGRQPIGEATVIARPVPVRDAPPLSPLDASRALTPEQAIRDTVSAAAPRQAGLAPLFADLERVAQTAIPAPVRAAAANVLALRVPLDEQLTASDLKQALARSGVLLEPRLAAGTAPTPGNDLKAALLVLRQVLKVWSASEPAGGRPANLPLSASAADLVRISQPGNGAALIREVTDALSAIQEGPPLSPEQATSLAKALAGALASRDAPPQAAASPPSVPPPFRGAPLSAQAPAASSLLPDATPHEAAEHLLAAADGALARQTLLQVASLPDQPDLPRADAAQRWSFEVPFATPQGTAMAQFEVSRDGRSANADAHARVWRARFTLDIEPMGPVHAMVALTGARASVSLWAERLSTATQLSENAPLLRDALRAAELEPADFQMRVGVPPVAAKQAAPGRFMDRAS